MSKLRAIYALKLWLLMLLLSLPAAIQAQLSYFPIATQTAASSCASDGSNYLAGLEHAGSPIREIGAQLFSANGTRIGQVISTGRTGVGTGVAFDGTNYLLIWEDDALGTLTEESYRVYGQFISKAGLRVGIPFDISGLGVQFDGVKPMVFGDGKYMVTYTRLIDPAKEADSENICIAGRIVSPSGSVSQEFRISTGYGKESDVAFDGTNFFVIWRESVRDQEIRGRFVSPAGVPGAEISVNASPAPSDNPKSVCFNGENYLVVWNDEVGGAGSMEWDCFGQLVSPSGTLVAGPIPITTEPGPQMIVSAASDGANYLAVWIDMQSMTNWNVYGRHLSRSGSLIGSKVTVSADPGNQLSGVGFANSSYLILVNNGVMMGEGGIESVDSATGAFIAPLPNPQVQTADSAFGVRNNQFGFSVEGTAGQTFVVEACSNLASHAWSPLWTNTLSGAPAYFSDPQWTKHPGRFYRLRFE